MRCVKEPIKFLSLHFLAHVGKVFVKAQEL